MKFPLRTGFDAIFVGILFAFCANANESCRLTGPGQTEYLAQVNRSLNRGISPAVDYAPIPLERLVGIAELIVIGTVESVEKRQLNIRVDESLLSKPVNGVIVIKLGERVGLFPPRLVPYAKGQQFIFFLGKGGDQEDGQNWSILGHPIAGELPVDASFAYYASYDLKGFDFALLEVHGVKRPMQCFDLGDFKNSVRMYRDCFSWAQIESVKNRRKITRWVPAQICDKKVLDRYRANSPIHEYLIRMTMRQIPDSGRP